MHQRPEGDARARVEKQIHALARGEQAAVVLALHPLGTAEPGRHRAPMPQFRQAVASRC